MCKKQVPTLQQMKKKLKRISYGHLFTLLKVFYVKIKMTLLNYVKACCTPRDVIMAREGSF